MPLEPKWIEVNLSNIVHNTKIIKSKLHQKVKLMAVVKANGYGHHIIGASLAALEGGAEYLGVTSLREARTLRDDGILAPIIILATLLPEEIEESIKLDLTSTATDEITLQKMNKLAGKLNKKVKVHLTVDSGMGRYGVPFSEIMSLTKLLFSLENLLPEGIYTHFPGAMLKNINITRKHLKDFVCLCSSLEEDGFYFPIKHAANSAAFLKLPESHLDMVRIGNLLYGQATLNRPVDLLPAWKLKGKITKINKIPVGTRIGYGLEKKLKRDSLIGVVPLGFSDGFGFELKQAQHRFYSLLRALAKEIARYLDLPFIKTKIYIDGKNVSLLGRIGMQHLLLDITDFPEVKVGDCITITTGKITSGGKLPYHFITAGTNIFENKSTAEFVKQHNSRNFTTFQS